MSPSGRLCIGWPRAGDLPRRVWEVATGRILADLPVTGVYGAAFSFDDHLLITGNDREYQAWDTETWTNVWKVSRPNSQQSGRVALNHTGTMGALTLSGQTIRLFDPATGSEFATLEAPEPQIIIGLAFSPDGSRLAATTATSVVHMWDLRLIRRELADMTLDWDGPQFPTAVSPESKQISVEVLVDASPNRATPTKP